MALVKVNRELLTDVVGDLRARHVLCCTDDRPCPTAQRLTRIESLLVRTEAEEKL